MNTPLFMMLPSFLSLLTAAGLGALVLSRNPARLTNRLFATGMAALFVMELGNSLALWSGTGSMLLFFKRLSLSGEILMPIAWLAFCLVFGRLDAGLSTRSGMILLGTAAPATILFLALLGSNRFIRLAESEGPPGLLSLGTIGHGFYVYLLLSSVLILMHLEGLLRSAAELERWRIKYLLIGIGAIFGFFIYSASEALLYSSLFIPLIPMQSILHLAAMGLVGFALVRHRNLDVDVFVSRHVVYGSTLLLIVGVYLIGIGLFAKAVSLAGGRIHPFLIPLIVFLSMIGLLILLMSGWIRRRIALFISEHFYKHKYDFHLKWLEAAEKIGSKQTVRELIGAVTAFLKETLGADDVTVCVYEPKTGRLVFPGRRSAVSGPPLADSLIRRWVERPVVVPLQDTEADAALDPFRKKNAAILVPLTADGRLMGVIAVGPDMTGKPYVQNDHDLLTALAKQVAYQLLNARLTDELAQAKQLEAFHELSTFVIHDLKNLTHTLSLLARNSEAHLENPEFRREAIESLRLIVDRLNVFILRLSGLSKGFRLNRREADLNRLIQDSIGELNGKLTNQVVSDLSPLPAIPLDRDQLRAVVVNLLTNAQEALGEKTGGIRVSTRLLDGWIELSVADGGRGMSADFIEQQLFKPFRTTKSGGLGIGLFQAKKIIEAHGGTIEVDSREGVGTTFTLRLPCRTETKN
jgi:putative PEP-CTERM system histidine kinase